MVSFIIPCLNSALTLGRTLQSILAQKTSEAFEVIVVDNGSQDSTIELARRFPVRVESCSRRGAGAARNYGAQRAHGDYLAFIDSDVVLAENWLELIVNGLRSTGFHVGLGRVTPSGPKSFLNDFRLALNRSRYAKEAISLFDLQGRVSPVVNTAACIYKKVFFLAHGGFDERLSRLEDTEMSLRIFLHGSPIFATRKAESYVYNTGTLWGYLVRSRNLGCARRELSQVSQSGQLSHSSVYFFEVFRMHKEFRGLRQHAFYYLNIFFNLIGFLQSWGTSRLTAQPLKPHLITKALHSFHIKLGPRSYRLTPNCRLISVDEEYYFYYPVSTEPYRVQINAPADTLLLHVAQLQARQIILPA